MRVDVPRLRASHGLPTCRKASSPRGGDGTWKMKEQRECLSAWQTASHRCESWKETEHSGGWCPVLLAIAPHPSTYSLQNVDVR